MGQLRTNDITKYFITSLDGSFERFEVTDDYASWQELFVDQTRDQTSAVFVMTSAPVELTGRSRDFVNGLVQQYGLFVKASFDVYKRDNWHIDQYTLVASLIIDFLTYRDFNKRVSFECRESELVDYYNSNGRVKYDIPVSEIADPKGWQYQRIQMINRGNYTPLSPNAGTFTGDQTFFVYLNSAELTPGAPEHDFKTQNHVGGTNDYFFRAAQNTELKVSIRHLEIHAEAHGVQESGNPSYIYIQRFRSNGSPTGDRYELPIFFRQEGDDEQSVYSKYWDGDVSEDYIFSMSGGDYLCMYQTNSRAYTQTTFLPIESCEAFSVNLVTQGRVLNGEDEDGPITMIDPEVLLQRFVDEMTNRPGEFSSSIQWKDQDFKTMIVAAESIRNFPMTSASDNLPVATLHGSPDDFAEWMRTLGYEIEFVGKSITFRPRNDLFRRDVVALKLSEREMADLVTYAHDQFAYTSVEIGYEKQDYESVNGRFEANGLFQYTTGFTCSNPNNLDLKSPYRADSIGIELLCWKRNTYTEDTASDNDIFFVAVTDKGDHYEEYVDIQIIDKDSGVAMFNAPYNPYFLVADNESLIGIISTELRFTSTDMNNNAMITGIDDIYANRPITEQLFKPFIYNFAAGHHHRLPAADVRNGVVEFTFEGITRKGYIKQIRCNEAKEKETEWDLYVVS